MSLLNKTKNCVCANKKVTHFFSKKIMYVQVDKKKKKKGATRQRKKERRNIWAWMNPLCTCIVVFLSHQLLHFLPTSFLSSFERKLFSESKEKILESYHLFSFLFIQPTTFQKSFSSHFLSNFFHLPYFNSKQTHPNGVATC